MSRLPDKESLRERGVSIFLHVTDPDMRVGPLLEAYDKALTPMGRPLRYVFILDGVGGRVFQELEALQAHRGDVRLLGLQGGGNGESIAFTAGKEHAQGAYLVTAPDYLQIDPAVIPAMVDRLEEGADLVSGWRHPRVDPWLNRLQSSFFNWFLRRMSGTGLHDLNCTFRAMKREVLEEVPIYGDQFRFLPILAERRGFKVTEIPVRHLEERGKTGFFGVGVYLRRLLDIMAVTFLTRFTSKPLRFFGILGLTLILLGLVFSVPPVYMKLFLGESIQDRPIFLMGVVLITFGLQLIGFGLVGEVIIFTQARNLKDYKVDRVLTRNPGALREAERKRIAREVLVPGPMEERTRLRVRHAAPGEDAWLDAFTESHSRGSPYHLSCWRRMVEEVSGHRVEVLVAERGKEILGFLPFSVFPSVFLGKVAVSIPYAVYGGPLAEDSEVARVLVEEAARMTEEAECRYLELRMIDALEGVPGLETSDRYLTYFKDLPQDPEDCLGILPRKARAEARKGRDESRLRLVEGCDLRTFQRLFASNKKSLGSPAIPLSMLQSLERHLGSKMVLHRVEEPGGRIVAAVCSFVFKETLLPYYSGAVGREAPRGMNNFMYWKLMCAAVEMGCKVFDFGRSRRDSGAAMFKQNMGFEPTSLHYQYRLGPKGSLPDFHPDNPKLGFYRKAWMVLPSVATKPVEGMLFRQLP